MRGKCVTKMVFFDMSKVKMTKIRIQGKNDFNAFEVLGKAHKFQWNKLTDTAIFISLGNQKPEELNNKKQIENDIFPNILLGIK